MARQSSDKDDLMAEVVTLSPRVALLIPGMLDEIIAGKRTDGRWSIFFGGDSVYHFNSQNRLRRAFLDGNLYRSQGATLARLTRQPTPSAMVLLRHDLDAAELADFLQQMRLMLSRLVAAIKFGTVTIQQSIPPTADFLPELAQFLNLVLNAQSPLAPPLKK